MTGLNKFEQRMHTAISGGCSSLAMRPDTVCWTVVLPRVRSELHRLDVMSREKKGEKQEKKPYKPHWWIEKTLKYVPFPPITPPCTYTLLVFNANRQDSAGRDTAGGSASAAPLCRSFFLPLFPSLARFHPVPIHLCSCGR